MRFDARHLDADTLRYLRFIDAAAGHGAPGVFERFAVRPFRPDRPTGLGTFTYADPLHAWIVRGDDVRAYPLAGLEQATGTHHYQGHLYTHSVVTLSTDRG